MSRTDSILQAVEPYWQAIEKCAAKSINRSASGFLPELSKESILGCGFWGCVFPTADKRFVVKLSLDMTEGPLVALTMDGFPYHPGAAYFHRIWRLPKRVWTMESGRTPLYVIVREEADVDSTWTIKKTGRKTSKGPARGFKKIHDALEELPSCCGCISSSISNLRRGHCTKRERDLEVDALMKILRRVGLGARKSKGQYVASLIKGAFFGKGVLFGDVHFGNVGLRRHDLSDWGVPRHKKLIVTDLGDLNQPPRVEGSYPNIASLNPNVLAQYAAAIPVLPC